MNGRLGKVEAGVLNFVPLYTPGVGVNHSVVNVLVCNTNSTEVAITIAISTMVSPSPNDYIESAYALPANGHLERTALVISGDESVLVYASGPGVICRAHGFEKSA